MFNNPDDFYVQVKSQEILNNISKLSVKLKDYDGVIHEDYIPSRGEVCVAKYSLDQVTDVLFVCSKNSSGWLIFMVGCQECVSNNMVVLQKT